MAYESVKNQIDAYIKANGVNLITGPVLNAVLTTMLDELGEGYAFQGVLDTTDTPSPAADIPQAWLASAGTYLGGSITVDEGELALIIHTSDGWSKETVYRGVQLSYEAIVAALGYTPADDADLAEKQDTIADLSAIRSGAALGSTSVQPVDIENMVEAEPIGSIIPPVNPSEFAMNVKLTKNGQPVFPVTDESLVTGLNYRPYDSENPNGMGYLVLKKNKTFAEQVTEENTIYEIRHNFNLNNGSVTIPAGCVLKFVGGRLSNGTITGNYTRINAALFPVFYAIIFSGTFDINKIYPVWFVGDDNDRVQSAISLSSLTDGGEVIINAQFVITQTITEANRVVFTGGGNLKINADVDGLVVTQDNGYIRGGRIWVSYNGYSKSVIKFSSPLSRFKITDTEIEGYSYSNPTGTGIQIGTTSGRQFGHILTNIKVKNFAIGIDIDTSGDWANNFRISASVEYNNVSVYIHGTNESSRHYINLTGQAPYSVANGVIVRDTTTINGSLWVLNVFDVGRTSYIDNLIDIVVGNVICPIEQLFYCRQNGEWNHFLQLPYSGADSCVNNCDGASWITRSLIGTGSDLLTNPLFQYGQATYPASDALGYCNADGDGVKVEIAFPEAIDLEQIILMAKTNNAPQKVIIEATGAATESVEIAGNRIVDGRVFRASELFTWRGINNCTKLVFNILGTPNGNYPGYCRMRYIGVVDKRFHKFTV